MPPDKPDVQTPTEPRHRFGFRWLLITGILVFFGIQYHTMSFSGYPYEGWDEVGTYNNSAVMWTPLRTRTYAYGFLDTAKMALGRVLNHEPLKPGTSGLFKTYSNNVPESWSSDSFDIAERDKWISLSAVDFNYFRGVPDRTGIHYARVVNVLSVLLLALISIALAEMALGPIAGWAATLGLCWLLSTYPFASQATQALPNAPNALLAFLTVLLSGCAVFREQWRWAMAAAVCVALGVNHKFDFLALGLPVFLAASFLSVAQYGTPVRSIKRVLGIGLVFVAVLTLTNPYLIASPISEIQRQLQNAQNLTRAAADLSINCSILLSFLGRAFSFSASGATSTIFIVYLGSLGLIVASGLALAAPGRRPWLNRISIVLVALSPGIVLIAVPILRSTQLYERYFLNGLSSLLAAALLGIVIAIRSNRRYYILLGALAGLVIFIGVPVRMLALSKQASELRGGLAPETHLDLRYSRNRAVQFLLAHPNPQRVVLVDQHAYFDLRAIKDSGFEAKQINCLNFEDVFRSLPPGNYFVVYAPGDYEIEPRWVGLWTPPTRKAYDTYIDTLSALPPIKSFPGKRMRLLDWRPPLPSDEIRVSEFLKVE